MNDCMIKEQAKKRVKWVDAAKGLGLIFVVLGHLQIKYLSTWIYTFHIPLFFFLSGFVFSGEKYKFREFFVKKVKTLVVPYFCLGFGIFVVWCGIYAVQSQPPKEYFIMLWNFIKQEHFWTVWFLACLFLVEILYYWVDKTAVKYKWLSTIVSLILCVIAFVWYRLGGKGLPWNLDVALVAQLFFHLGYLFKKYPKIKDFLLSNKPLRSILLIVCFGVINVVSGFACIRVSGQSLDMSIGMYGNELLTIISAFSGIICAVIFCNAVPLKVFTYLGENTMLIFAWHSRIVLVLMQYLYEAINVFQGTGFLEHAIGAGIIFIVIFAVLIPINELIKRSKLKFIIGRYGDK